MLNQNIIANTIFRYLYTIDRILFNKVLISSDFLFFLNKARQCFKNIWINSLVFRIRWRCKQYEYKQRIQIIKKGALILEMKNASD